MKIYLSSILIIAISLFSCQSRHTNKNPIADTKQEFARMKWLQGIWQDRNDSLKTYQAWAMPNDTSMEETGWVKQGNDSTATERFVIQNEDDGIIMSVEFFQEEANHPLYYHLVSNKNGIHIFEDQGNNYPQRLIFRLNPDGSLYFRKEGIIDGSDHFNEQILNKIK